MKSLMIKDLEISKELTREDLSAVRGGGNATNFSFDNAQVRQYTFGAAAVGGGVGNTATSVVTPTALAFNVNPINLVSIG